MASIRGERSGASLCSRLDAAWRRVGASSAGRAAVQRWTDEEPALAGVISALDMLARCQRHADSQEALAAVLRLAGRKEFARQTVIQTIPPGLVALARRAHYMVRPGLAGWASEDELEQEIVITEGLTDALTARTRPISLISEVDVAHRTTTLEPPAGFDDRNDWRQAAGRGFRTQLDHAIGKIGPARSRPKRGQVQPQDTSRGSLDPRIEACPLARPPSKLGGDGIGLSR